MQASGSQPSDNRNSSRKQRRSLLGTPGNPQELAHSLSVASSVDQGTSLAQAAIWHMADQDAQAASRTGHQQASSSAVQQAAAAATPAVGYGDQQRAYSASAVSSSNQGSRTSGSSSTAGGGGRYAEVPAGISLASGCISGFITATVTFPLDVVRRRMQVTRLFVARSGPWHCRQWSAISFAACGCAGFLFMGCLHSVVVVSVSKTLMMLDLSALVAASSHAGGVLSSVCQHVVATSLHLTTPLPVVCCGGRFTADSII